jgi:hypothetical protein
MPSNSPLSTSSTQPYFQNAVSLITSHAFSVKELNQLSIGALAPKIRERVNEFLGRGCHVGRNGRKEDGVGLTFAERIIRWTAAIRWGQVSPSSLPLFDRILNPFGWQGVPAFLDSPYNEMVAVTSWASFPFMNLDFSGLVTVPSCHHSSSSTKASTEEGRSGLPLQLEVFANTQTNYRPTLAFWEDERGLKGAIFMKKGLSSKGVFRELQRCYRG